MFDRKNVGGYRTAIATSTALGALFFGCIDRPVEPLQPRAQSGVSEEIRNEGIDKVDLLMMVDNSNSMRDNQANIMAQFANMINTLVNPPCTSTTNPTPHACVATDPNDHTLYPPVSNMNVGVVDSDLGTPNSQVPGCDDSMSGDDGLLNPIRYGAALAHHEPWTSANPTTFPRPTDCSTPDQFPSFITFDSSMAATVSGYTTQFVHDFQCNAGLYVNGCGLESQLEAVWRGLIYHNARAPMGDNPNAGFLRDDALLAIVVLSDEEDGSTRNCQYAGPDPCPSDGLDVYQASSTNWSSPNLNLRYYMYQPGGAQDPTWNLDRYVTPTDPNHGYLSVKPNHPERVLFAGILGIPLSVGVVGGTMTSTESDWDPLLGTPDPNNVDNFYGRNAGPGSMAINMMSPEGPISMQQANLDAPNCPERTVPSCRRAGSTYSPTACTTDLQYFAWPSRRIVEVARRFDLDPLCNGAPCHNGLVTSICATDYAPAMNAIVQKIQSRLTGKCLPRPLQTTQDAAGDLTVQCVVQEEIPVDPSNAATDMCDATHGRTDPLDNTGTPAPSHITVNGVQYRVCDISQVPVSPTTMMPADMTLHGWYYDTTPDTSGGSCTQRISFTANDAPVNGSTTRLECIQSISGG